MVAAGKGRMQTVMTLLSHGADVQQKSRDGSTASDWAKKFGHTEVFQFLQEHAEVITPPPPSPNSTHPTFK